MKKILIPTDFSETSMNAMEYAMELLKYTKCEFTIMHVFADELYKTAVNIGAEDFEDFKHPYHSNIDKTLQKAIGVRFEKSPNPKHTYKYESRFGTLVNEINHLIDRDNVDIVIMGSKGETNDSCSTFGSNTLQVFQYVHCPVLAVPNELHGLQLKNILFPMNYMLTLRDRELGLTSALAASHNAAINVMFISEFKDLLQRLQNKVYVYSSFEVNKTCFIETTGDDITKQINSILTEHDFDMLVMVNHSHSYIENILRFSTIEEIGLQIKIPFLVLQNIPRSH